MKRLIFLATFLAMALIGTSQVSNTQTIVKQGKDYVFAAGSTAGIAKPYGANLIVGTTSYPI